MGEVGGLESPVSASSRPALHGEPRPTGGFGYQSLGAWVSIELVIGIIAIVVATGKTFPKSPAVLLLVILTFFMVVPHLMAQTNQETHSEGKGWQGWWNGNSILPDITGTNVRQELADAGVSFGGAYTAYFLGNASGGRSRGFAYNHMLFFQLTGDLEKLVNWQGATLVWSWADNAGSNLSNTIGNNFQASTGYGPNSFIFNELYLMQTVLDGRLAFKVGQLSALNDFAASPLYNAYINLAFSGNPIGIPLNVPLTALPSASWGAHVRYTAPEWYAQAGVYQTSNRIGVPAYHGLDYSIRSGDGIMVIVETGWTPSFCKSTASEPQKTVTTADPSGYPGNYKVGLYFSNGSYAPFSDGSNLANVYGFYLLADQMVYQESANPDQGMFLWSAFTVAPQQLIAQLPFFVSGGVQYVGLIPERDKDRAIFGVAYGRYSQDLASRQASLKQPQETYELVLEWSYQIQVNSWLTVQPDLQYIVNPGAAGTLQNAWVLGAVVNVSF